jgi:catechol 2,3-dioxygenase-like lactoylglutathione lyase family enzyme
MPSGIDHVVLAVPDPEAAASQITEQAGLAFTAGGRHDGLGTFNRIAFLGDAYLELMGVEDRDDANGWAVGAAAVRALERGGGFATWALVDDVIRSTVAGLQVNGSHIGPVAHGSRERPDGERVEWWSAMPPELGPDRPPFLIKHLEAGAEWGADAIAARRAYVHPIGGPVRLLGLELAIPDPVGLAADCLREIGVEYQAIGSSAAAEVGRQTIRLRSALAPAMSMTLTLGVGESGHERAVSAFGVEFVMQPATP